MLRLGVLTLVGLGICLGFGQGSAAFTFDPAAGISNRFITPNGDGKNDSAVFTFSNLRDSEVTGKIYDLNGQFVAEMTAGPTLGTTLKWDGRKDGRVVDSGLYVFCLAAEDKRYAGVVAVIR